MADYTTAVQEAYVGYYGRPADPAGLTYWSGKLDAAKGDWSVIVESFGNSQEATEMMSGLNYSQQVNLLFNQILGRDADTYGLNFYTEQLMAGTMTTASLAINIINGATGDDVKTLDNKVATAVLFTAGLDTTEEILAYNGLTVSNVRNFMKTVTSEVATQTAVDNAIADMSKTTNDYGVDLQLTRSRDSTDPNVTSGTGVNILKSTTGDDKYAGTVDTTNGVTNTVNSDDWIDGGGGTDTATLDMLTNYTMNTRFKSIEKLVLGTNQPAVNFDYNVNVGSQQITDVTEITYDQINTGETLTLTNVLRTLDTAKVLPSTVWTNEAGSAAGNTGIAFRESAVSEATTALTSTFNNVNSAVTADTAALGVTSTNGRFDLGTGIETLNIVSNGSTTGANTLNNRAGGPTNQTGTVDIYSGSGLSTVNISGTRAFGQTAGVIAVTDGQGGYTNRVVTTDIGFVANASEIAASSNISSLARTVTKVDATSADGGVALRFTANNTGVDTNVTFMGGKGADYVEFEIGNVSATSGDGADTFAFLTNKFNGTLGENDTLTGGAGDDTLLVGMNGDAGGAAAAANVYNAQVNYTIGVSELRNKTGIEVLDDRAFNSNITVSSAFVAGADNRTVTVRTDKIVQTSATDTSNLITGTIGNNGSEDRSTHLVNLTDLLDGQGITFLGGSGSDRLVLDDTAYNSLMTLNGGAMSANQIGRAAAGNTMYDTITLTTNGEQVVIDSNDLAKTSNFQGYVLTKGSANATYSIQLTESFILANTMASDDVTRTAIDDRVFEIGTRAAANHAALGAGDTVTIDVSNLFTAGVYKGTLAGRSIDTASLENAGVTVQYMYNNTLYANRAALQTAVPGATDATIWGARVVGTAAANAADVLGSAANAIITPTNIINLTAGGTFTGTAGVNDTFTGNIASLVGTTVTGTVADTETLTITDAGTFAIPGTFTNLDILNLANGTNVVTAITAAGIRTVNGGTGSDTVTANAAGMNFAGNAGNDSYISAVGGALAATLDGGTGVDTLTLINTNSLQTSTVTNFENLVITAGATVSVGANSLLSQFSQMNASATGSSETLNVNAGSHDISGVAIGGFLQEAGQTFTVNVAAGATATIGGDAQLPAATTIFTGAGTLSTIANLTMAGATDTITNVNFGAAGLTITTDGAAAQSFTGSTGADILVLGNPAAAQTVNISQGGSDTVRLDAAGTAAATTTITGFLVGALAAGGDKLSLSYTAATCGLDMHVVATGANISGDGNAAVGAIANVAAFGNAAQQVGGLLTNAGAVQSAIASMGATAVGNDFYYVAVDNGTDTGIYRFQFVDAGADSKITLASEITTGFQLVGVLSGVADVSTLTAANIA